MRTPNLSRYHLVTGLAILLLIALPGWWALVLVGYFGVVALGVTFPRLQFFLPVTCRGPRTRKAVALTFDDGPDAEATPKLLDLLARLNVKATFFCVGSKLEQNLELGRRMVAEGHLLGNHGFSHSYRTNLFSVADLRTDLARCQDVLSKATGQAAKWFRPPVGLTNPRVARVVRELGLATVGWSAGGGDQQAKSAEEIVARVRRGVAPGAIILLHDAGGTGTVLLAAMEQLINELRREGYQICRLDELLSH